MWACIAALALWATAAVTAADQAPDAPRSSTPYAPDWERTPTRAEFNALFPRAAAKAGTGGHTRMRCRVTEEGTLAACEITEETPEGLGFGDAMLRTAPLYRMRMKTLSGKAFESGTVIIPHTWRVTD